SGSINAAYLTISGFHLSPSLGGAFNIASCKRQSANTTAILRDCWFGRALRRYHFTSLILGDRITNANIESGT
ncbi:MAG TPA: hypothetical protein V6D48_09870, partial [Oculatellaceae cyanobacterium]